jgi:hypothetical protein
MGDYRKLGIGSKKNKIAKNHSDGGEKWGAPLIMYLHPGAKK